MSDTEAGRESLPSISDLSLNPQSTPSTKTTDAKVKKDVEKGLNAEFQSELKIGFAINLLFFCIF